MELCDDFRDQKLVDLGVKLEDKVDETGNPIIKLADRESLIKEREEKARIQKEKEEKKRLAAEKKAREEAEKVTHISQSLNDPRLSIYRGFHICFMLGDIIIIYKYSDQVSLGFAHKCITLMCVNLKPNVSHKWGAPIRSPYYILKSSEMML